MSTCDDDITATTTTRPPLNNDNLITPNSPATTPSTRQLTQTPGIHINTINSDPIFQRDSICLSGKIVHSFEKNRARVWYLIFSLGNQAPEGNV